MYYPKSQIKTNLLANPGEFVNIQTLQPYSGYYFLTSTGKYFTGKTPQDIPNNEIIPSPSLDSNHTSPKEDVFLTSPVDNISLSTSQFILDYQDLREESDIRFTNIPPYHATTPTPQDYQNTEFRRFFCKKSNETQYIEISLTTYNLLITKNPDILWQLYLPFNLPWQLTGDIGNVGRTNKNIVELTSQRLKLPKLGDYLNHNYIKYYK